MTKTIVPININEHQNTKIIQSETVNDIAEQHVCALLVHEFASVSSEMPIVFLKNSESGEFQSVALLGLSTDENLFIHNNKWLASYTPANIRRAPFSLAKTSEQEVMICIDESSRKVSNEEGEALFNGQQETEFFTNVKTFLTELAERETVTHAFIKFIESKGLIQSRTLNIDISGEKKALSGIYTVDKQRLDALSDEDYLDLRKRGLLDPIYHHLVSLNQVSRLLQMKAQAIVA